MTMNDQRPSRKKSAAKFALVLMILLFVAAPLVGAFYTVQATKNAQQFSMEQASADAKIAHLVSFVFSKATGGNIASIEAWNTGLEIIPKAEIFMNQLQKLDLAETNDDLDIEKLHAKTSYLIEQIEKSDAASMALGEKKQQLLESLQTFETVLNHFAYQERTYFVMLQNNHEVRATGGFMGSFAKVKLDKGQVSSIEFFDIYTPDGQIEQYIEPPVGVKEYLSGGEGWRLPDTNWSPNLPTSAKDILYFMSMAGHGKTNGVVMLNLSSIEKLLDITGEINMPDYNTKVDSSNVAEVARQGREDFFPGDRQKINFLGSLFNSLKIELASMDAEKQKQLLSLLIGELDTKEIQFYSTDNDLQTIFSNLGIAGEITKIPKSITTYFEPKTNPDLQNRDPRYFYLVESNVGINKANVEVLRSIKVDLNPSFTDILIDFFNKNTKPHKKTQNPDLQESDHMGYVNYQRLLLNPKDEVVSIKIDNKNIEKWDEAIIDTLANQQFKQIGFIVTIPEQSTQKVEIRVKHPTLAIGPKTVIIQKQPGLEVVEYQLNYKDQTKQIVLEKDILVEFE